MSQEWQDLTNLIHPLKGSNLSWRKPPTSIRRKSTFSLDILIPLGDHLEIFIRALECTCFAWFICVPFVIITMLLKKYYKCTSCVRKLPRKVMANKKTRALRYAAVMRLHHMWWAPIWVSLGSTYMDGVLMDKQQPIGRESDTLCLCNICRIQCSTPFSFLVIIISV